MQPPETTEPIGFLPTGPLVPRARGRSRARADVGDEGRSGAAGQYRTDHVRASGGAVLAVQSATAASPSAATAVRSSTAAGAGVPSEGAVPLWFGWTGHWPSRHRALLFDALAVLVASLDVTMAVPDKGAATYSLVLSGVAVVALVFRRRFPFAATIVAMPGFLAGWSELGAMIALGTLAWRRGWNWRTFVAAAGVWACRFLIWSSPPASPLHDFAQETWRQHVSDGIYACFVIAMPIAIGLLVTARYDLRARIVELAASRGREQRLQAIAIRADERARIAREMHDVVSHQVSLIAMQAGALQVTTADDTARETAATIRGLSSRTLDELRHLLGALRTATDGAEEPNLDTVVDMVRDSTMDVTLRMDLAGRTPPGPVAGAAYRTVQEALTNIGKHAAYAPATVLIEVADGDLVVQVDNAPPAVPNPAPTELPSGGHGLLGLRERAALLGGDCSAGPTVDGGFTVRARLPLPPES